MENLFYDVHIVGTATSILGALDYMPTTIFISSNKEYAYDAMKYDATGFVLKPVNSICFNPMLRNAIDKLKASIATYDIYRKSKGFIAISLYYLRIVANI
ncbi:hypothetical protein CHU92_00765 [Flavobacterium cyanobacteriorum]|uniref:Uncharacterized protein n=1 Tax=Flavobacterium cyanobacteriorum TaxID=2022802 RepID=A0A256A323_9FLAO|nr:hypothetical protein [Flavobacterium cyanobacteriorum]OYQ48247.1 hypothetical protein CHU92_00765 [Flavobacterium cyanobacteriorum]